MCPEFEKIIFYLRQIVTIQDRHLRKTIRCTKNYIVFNLFYRSLWRMWSERFQFIETLLNIRCIYFNTFNCYGIPNLKFVILMLNQYYNMAKEKARTRLKKLTWNNYHTKFLHSKSILVDPDTHLTIKKNRKLKMYIFKVDTVDYVWISSWKHINEKMFYKFLYLRLRSQVLTIDFNIIKEIKTRKCKEPINIQTYLALANIIRNRTQL